MSQSEEKFRNLFEEAPIAYLTVGTDSIIDECNKMAQQVSGYDRDELIGKNVIELFFDMPDSKEKAKAIFHRVLHGETICHERIRMIKKDSSLIWANLTANAMRDRNGKTIAGRWMVSDITEHVDLEAKLQQARKMEAIGIMAGGIAHEFNNLLMGIQGNASLMLLGIDSSHSHYKRLKGIENQIQNGVKLTNQLLGYSRRDRYELKPLDLNRLVKENSDAFGKIRKEITVHRELAEDLFVIEADQGQIEQVILSLFVNAADAMPGGGDLVLKTMNATHEDIDSKLYEPKPGNYALLTVADTGTGMDQETLQRVFDPFFTTKEMGRGTGLSLAVVYGTIKGHGGYIDVDSEKWRGTTFTVYLPASEKEIPKPVKTGRRLAKGTGTVLLVDDERVIRKVGKAMLEAMGHTVLVAGDGKEAVEVYRKKQDNIDIVILDIVMPNMRGREAYDRMKEINPNVKVLLSSGFSVNGEAGEILERGCNGFIQKPFTMKALSRKIREVLGTESIS